MLCVLELRIESKSIHLWFTCIIAGSLVWFGLIEGLDPEAKLMKINRRIKYDSGTGSSGKIDIVIAKIAIQSLLA